MKPKQNDWFEEFIIGFKEGAESVSNTLSKFIRPKEELKPESSLIPNPNIKGEYVEQSFEFKELKLQKKVEGNFQKFLKGLYQKSKIIVTIGARDEGKTALSSRVAENINRVSNKKIYYIKQEQELPFIEINEINEAERGSVVLVDEGAISMNSRNSMSKTNKSMSEIMAISRHLDLTLIFNTQNDGLIDKNVLGLCDTVIIKQSSLLQERMSRRELRDLYSEAKKHLKNKGKEYAYIIDKEFVGLIKSDLPSFWSENDKKT